MAIKVESDTRPSVLPPTNGHVQIASPRELLRSFLRPDQTEQIEKLGRYLLGPTNLTPINEASFHHSREPLQDCLSRIGLPGLGYQHIFGETLDDQQALDLLRRATPFGQYLRRARVTSVNSTITPEQRPVVLDLFDIARPVVLADMAIEGLTAPQRRWNKLEPYWIPNVPWSERVVKIYAEILANGRIELADWLLEQILTGDLSGLKIEAGWEILSHYPSGTPPVCVRFNSQVNCPVLTELSRQPNYGP